MRASGWEQHFANFILEAGAIEFQWGVHDCVMFAADAIKAMRGDDPIADLRGAWHTRSQAYAKIKELGGFEAAISARLGAPLEAAQLAGRGDVVLTDAGVVAVVVLAYAVAPKRTGLLRYEPKRWTVGWRVA